MRPRKKKNAGVRIERCADWHVTEPAAQKGHWADLFEQKAPIHLEIGCGKGGFMDELSGRETGVNFVAMEKIADVIVMAMERIVRSERQNVRFVLDDAANLPEYFEPGELSRIYINFCDPWPKSRHEKRRLTYPGKLAIYKALLPSGGEIHFKTDNRPLFDYSLPMFEEAGFIIRELSYDLHAENRPDNIVTEYEKTFSEKGFKINRLVAVKP